MVYQMISANPRRKHTWAWIILKLFPIDAMDHCHECFVFSPLKRDEILMTSSWRTHYVIIMLFTWLVFATLMIWIVQYSNAYVNNLHNRLHIRFKFSYSLNIVTINYTSYDSYRMWYLVSSCHIYISKLKQILTSSSEALVPTVLSLRLFNAYRKWPPHLLSGYFRCEK